MSDHQVSSNMKLIVSGKVPTISTLDKGEIAFGEISSDRRIHMYGNTGSEVVEFPLNECVISGSYAEIATLRSGSKLIPGMKYLITDYRTIYKQLDTNIVMGNSGGINPSTLEPLMLTAVTKNSFSNIAISTTNPNDIIYYNFLNVTFGWATPEGMGVIYRRINPINNTDICYDYRNIRFRRWAIDHDSYPLHDPSVAYSAGAVVANSSSSNTNCALYVTSVAVPVGTSLSNTNFWNLYRYRTGGSAKRYWGNPYRYDMNVIETDFQDFTYGNVSNVDIAPKRDKTLPYIILTGSNGIKVGPDCDDLMGKVTGSSSRPLQRIVFEQGCSDIAIESTSSVYGIRFEQQCKNIMLELNGYGDLLFGYKTTGIAIVNKSGIVHAPFTTGNLKSLRKY